MVIALRRLRCTVKRVALLKFVFAKGNKVQYSDLKELVGKIVNTKSSLYELVRSNVRLGLIALNEYGEIYVTEEGLSYLERCKERGL